MENTLLIPGLEHVKAQPDFSRLRAAILRENGGGRPPFMELFADQEIIEAILGRPWQSPLDKIEFQYRLGYDSVSAPVGLHFPSNRTTAKNTAPMALGDRRWVTDKACPIQTREDFERYEWPDPDSIGLEPLEEIAAAAPEGMKLILQSSGVLENVMRLMGYTGLAAALYDDPDLVQAVFDQVGSKLLRAYERVIDHPAVGGVFFGEDMGFKTSTMMAPEHHRKYQFPYLKKIFDLAHRHDRFVVLHSCGNLREIMDDLIDDVGIDAKHSFEDAITQVAEFKREYGSRIGVVGGIDVDALSRMETDDFRRYVRRTLEECAPGGGYALGSGNSVTNYCKVENYLAMLEEGWRYGGD